MPTSSSWSKRRSSAATKAAEVSILWRLSLMEWYMGRWHHALEHATTALEIAEQTLDAHQRVFMGRITALNRDGSRLHSRKRAAPF